MALSASSTNIKLQDTVLNSSGDLNEYISADSKDWTFDANGSNPNARLEGSILHFSLPLANGEMLKGHTDLDLYLANIDGKLTCLNSKPLKSILYSCSCFILEGTTLQALCLGNDEKLHYSQIDLIEHLVNGNQRMLGDLRNHTQIFFVDLLLPLIASVTVSAATDDGPFSKDGCVTRFFEKAPFVGFGVAAFHFLKGDDERAKRAIAYCANSSIVCSGMIIGAVLGGPFAPIGQAIGAGIATPIGIIVETAIANNWVEDSDIKAEFEGATIERHIYDTIRNMSTALVAGYVAKFAGEALKPVLAEYVSDVMAKWGTKAGVVVSDAVMYQMLKRVADALNGRASVLAEWKETKEKVKELKKEKA